MRTWRALARAGAAVVAAVAGCSGPAASNGDAFVGIYRATIVVTIEQDTGGMTTMNSMSPVLIVRSTTTPGALVIDDGQCLLPATPDPGGLTLTLTPSTTCARYQAGATILLNLMSGTAQLMSGNALSLTASGMFNFVVSDSDAGGPPPIDGGPMHGAGNFQIAMTGPRL